MYAIRLGRIFALLPVQFVRTPRTGVRLLQEREENESGQLHSDGPRWDAAQGSGRKRSSFQPDRLLRFAAQGSSRCRPLEHRLSPEKDPTPSGRSLRGSSINYRRISVDRPKPKYLTIIVTAFAKRPEPACELKMNVSNKRNLMQNIRINVILV